MQKVDPIMTMQNKLNQLENILTLIVKNTDDDRSKKALKDGIRSRATVMVDALSNSEQIS